MSCEGMPTPQPCACSCRIVTAPNRYAPTTRRPGRLVVGAYLFGAVTILQLHAQGWGVGIPSQLMSALPYLATVIVLVLLSRARTGGSTAPAALGTVFVPDR